MKRQLVYGALSSGLGASTKRTEERARVFFGVLEHKGPGKLVAGIEWKMDINSAIHKALIEPGSVRKFQERRV